MSAHDDAHEAIDRLPRGSREREQAGANHLFDAHGIIADPSEAHIVHFGITLAAWNAEHEARQRATLALFGIG